jgi:hypothetical protein
LNAEGGKETGRATAAASSWTGKGISPMAGMFYYLYSQVYAGDLVILLMQIHSLLGLLKMFYLSF